MTVRSCGRWQAVVQAVVQAAVQAVGSRRTEGQERCYAAEVASRRRRAWQRGVTVLDSTSPQRHLQAREEAQVDQRRVRASVDALFNQREAEGRDEGRETALRPRGHGKKMKLV